MRFSIRTLFLVTTVVALTVWWLAKPSANAARFARAINAQEYDRAAKMFVVDGPDAVLTDWRPHAAVASVSGVTFSDLLRGRREVKLQITYHASSKDIMGHFPLEASCRGVHIFDKAPYLSGENVFR